MTQRRSTSPTTTPIITITRVIACLTLTSLTLTLTRGLTSDLFLSTAETGVLLESEGALMGFVHHCLTKTAQRTGDEEFTRLAQELQWELSSLPRGQDAAHPLDAYVGLRRFTHYWRKYIVRMDPLVARSVERSLAQSRLVYPDVAALQQTGRAIVRLQAAYNLSAARLAASAAANLTALDTARLASEARLTGLSGLAQGWTLLGASLAGGQGVQEEEDEATSTTQSQNHHAETKATVQLRRKLAKFFSLCRLFQDGSSLEAWRRSEGCVYTAGRTVPLIRWKTEVLSRDPYVALYHDFVTDREATVIVDRAMTKLTTALTGADPNNFTLQTHKRLGKTAWLRDASSRVTDAVSRRVQDVTGLHTAFRSSASFGEDFQVVNYGIGGHYIPHHDYFKMKNAFHTAQQYLQNSGDRAATFMIYLGDVSLGGATVFPDLGVGALPVKNAALFWNNFTPDGLPDPRTLHGGCPVIIGQKWVANKWIHEISTAMTKTCGASPWKPDNT